MAWQRVLSRTYLEEGSPVGDAACRVSHQRQVLTAACARLQSLGALLRRLRRGLCSRLVGLARTSEVSWGRSKKQEERDSAKLFCKIFINHLRGRAYRISTVLPVASSVGSGIVGSNRQRECRNADALSDFCPTLPTRLVRLLSKRFLMQSLTSPLLFGACIALLRK